MNIHPYLKTYTIDGIEGKYVCTQVTVSNGKEYGFLQHPSDRNCDFWYDPVRQTKIDDPFKMPE